MLAWRNWLQISTIAPIHRTLGVIVIITLLTNCVCCDRTLGRQQFGSPADVNGVYSDDGLSMEGYSVAELLEMLDSPVFSHRQMATDELTRRGESVVGPMAMHYLRSSPEAAWRIKKSLEAIGTSGDEATFLKSVGVLQLLVGNNNSSKLNAELDRLKMEWLQKQTELAINKLRAAGAEINNIGPARRFSTGVYSNEPDDENPPKPSRGEYMSLSQKATAIDEIVNGSLTSNRKLVLGSRDKIKKEPDESEKMVQAIQLQLAQQAIARADNVGFATGVIVKLGNSWKGNRSEFQELRNIDGLSQIVFQEQYIDNFTLATLSDLTSLTSLEFDKCRFSGPALATVGLPEFVNSLRFRNIDIEVSMIDRISKLNVNSLLFDNCDFSPAAMPKMLSLSSLNYLELINQELTSTDFKRLEKLKTLSQLRLSGTRFPFADYKKLTASRPELYIDFTTNAFLGVRSVQGLRDSCQISDVISNSGAEKGGVRVDDFILKVNGNEIEQFNDLRANISLKKPGEKLKLTIRRDGEILELEVVLGNIEDAPLQ